MAIGGTAVRTDLNTRPQSATYMAKELAHSTGSALTSASNKFEALAAALAKIANDVRWLASDSRCGLGELQLPENEPGSFITPGKVNPIQCEAVRMVCHQIFGDDLAMTWGGDNGNSQLNICKPLLVTALQFEMVNADQFDGSVQPREMT